MLKKHFVLLPIILLLMISLVACSSPAPAPSPAPSPAPGSEQTPAAVEEATIPFPEKPITYIVPYDPGGPSDREARRQQTLLEDKLGQKINVDFHIGGGGAIGWAQLVRSKADGYTISQFNLPNIVIQPLLQDVGYKTDEIYPICVFQSTPLSLIVLKDSPYDTLEDFIAGAQAKNGEMIFGGSGDFSAERLAALNLENVAGTTLKYVTFTGGAPRMTALLGGHVEAVFAGSDDLQTYRDEIKVLAVAHNERLELWPDVPTFMEKGHDLVASIDRCIGVPLNTPDDVAAKLEQVFLEIANNSAYQEQMKSEGAVPMTLGIEASKEYIEGIKETYQPLAEKLLQ